MFSVANMRLKDMLTVMTCPPICTVAVHIERDNTNLYGRLDSLNKHS
jgi:hypothetical protein